jgi:hypothetical protein
MEVGKGEDEATSEAGWWKIQVGWGRTEKTGPGEALKIQVWRLGISALGGLGEDPGEKGFTRRKVGAKKRGVEAPKRPEKTALQRENGPVRRGERLEEAPGHLA